MLFVTSSILGFGEHNDLIIGQEGGLTSPTQFSDYHGSEVPRNLMADISVA